MSFFKQPRIRNELLLKQVGELPCIMCGRMGVDVHHVTTKAAGGHDVATNLLPACRLHHSMIHAKGYGYMMNEFPSLRYWLEAAERHDILERENK